MPIYDFEAIAASQNKAQDQDRAKRQHDVNKDTRTKERKARKERSSRYSEGVRKKGGATSFDYSAYAQGGVRLLAMEAVEVVPPFVEPERSGTIYNLVPTATEYPTAMLVGSEGGAGSGSNIPWSVAPMTALPYFSDIIGTLIVFAGTRILAQFASKVSGAAVSYDTSDPSIRIRVNTGRGPGRGRYTRPRGKGGELPDDDADPYDQPSEWWEFWKWSFF